MARPAKPRLTGTTPDADILTFAQVSDWLQLSRSTINREIKAGHILPVKFGTGKSAGVRFRREQIQSWLDSVCPVAAA